MALVMGALFLLVSSIATVVSWGALWLYASIEMSGQRAEGRATNKNIVFSAGGDNDFIVECWFNLPNENALRRSAGFTQNSGTHCVLEKHLLFCTRHRSQSATFLWGRIISIGMTEFASVFFGIFTVFGALLVVGFIRDKRIKA